MRYTCIRCGHHIDGHSWYIKTANEHGRACDECFKAPAVCKHERLAKCDDKLLCIQCRGEVKLVGKR